MSGCYLEAFVLQDPLDSCILVAWSKLGLEHNAKGAISHNLALCVLHLTRLTSETILDFFTYNFCYRR